MIDFNYSKLNIATGSIFIILVLCIYIINSSNTIKNLFSHHKYDTYQIVTNSITGISTKSSVFVSGTNVGYVEKIIPKNAEYNKFILKIKLLKQVKLTSDTSVFMSYDSLLGGNKLLILQTGFMPDILAKNSYLYVDSYGISLNDLLSMIQQYLNSKNNN